MNEFTRMTTIELMNMAAEHLSEPARSQLQARAARLAFWISSGTGKERLLVRTINAAATTQGERFAAGIPEAKP